VSYLDELCAELARAGIRGALAARILDEFADHLACDPDADLGPPHLVAQRFADELGLARTRRSAKLAFGALALLAVLLVAASARSRYPQTPQHATVVALTGLAIFASCQIAFVAGVLAHARGVRRSLAAADRRLVQRRASVALAAGAATCVALIAHGILFRPMPTSWIVMTIAAGALPLPLLGYAATRVRAAARLTPVGGRAAGLSADLPGPLGRHPRGVLAALGVAAVALVVVQGSAFERSASEGPARGAVELVGLALGAAVLGRVLGLFT
jgi:hypothetical protein